MKCCSSNLREVQTSLETGSTDSENLVLEGNTEKVNKLAIDPDIELSDDSQNKNVSNEESD